MVDLATQTRNLRFAGVIRSEVNRCFLAQRKIVPSHRPADAEGARCLNHARLAHFKQLRLVAVRWNGRRGRSFAVVSRCPAFVARITIERALPPYAYIHVGANTGGEGERKHRTLGWQS